MKYILSFIILVSLVASYSCNDNVLGIEKNVNTIPIGDNSNNQGGGDTTTVPVKTIFRADSINVVYFERITWDKGKQFYISKWTPAMESYSAVIDTTSPAKLTMFLSATRAIDRDTISKLRKEHILAFEINTDSLILEHIYTTNKNTRVCRSKLVEQMFASNSIRVYNGNYTLQFEFSAPRFQDNYMVLVGTFKINAPLMMMRPYIFFFNGEFKIYFPMD